MNKIFDCIIDFICDLLIFIENFFFDYSLGISLIALFLLFGYSIGILMRGHL